MGGVVVLGAGITGRMIARVLRFNNLEFDWVGPSTSARPPGFFYVHYKLPLVAEKPVTVKARIVGDGGLEAYIRKTGGLVSRLSHSSIREVPYEKVGYMVDEMIWNESPDGCRVVSIDLSRQKVYTECGELMYDLVFSTIPLPGVASMLDKNLQFVSRPIYVEEVGNRPRESEIEVIEAIYDTSDSPYYRLTRYGDSYEVRESMSLVNQSCRPAGYGKIESSSEIEEFVAYLESRGFVQVGRFARWQPKMMLHDCYELLMTYLERWFD